jgi:hypothetical protein
LPLKPSKSVVAAKITEIVSHNGISGIEGLGDGLEPEAVKVCIGEEDGVADESTEVEGESEGVTDGAGVGATEEETVGVNVGWGGCSRLPFLQKRCLGDIHFRTL